MTHDEFSKLIERAVGGDRDALQRILVSNGARLSKLIRRKLPRSLAYRESVDDLLQQTYVQAIRGFRALEGRTEAALWAWLRTIAENQIRNGASAARRLKRSGRMHRVQYLAGARDGSWGDLVDMLSDRDDTPRRGAARAESIVAVQAAVAALPGDQRRAVELRCIEGRSAIDTADELDRSPGAVNALLNRAKRRLKASLGRSSKWFAAKN